MSQTEIKIDHHRKKNREGIEYKTVNAYQCLVVLGGVPFSSAWMSGDDSEIQKTIDAISSAMDDTRISVRVNKID